MLVNSDSPYMKVGTALVGAAFLAGFVSIKISDIKDEISAIKTAMEELKE